MAASVVRVDQGDTGLSCAAIVAFHIKYDVDIFFVFLYKFI